MNSPLTDAEDNGQTPLDPDEAAGLKLSFITTRADLNIAEASNILQSVPWAEQQLRRGTRVASDGFLRDLHRQMFGDVWDWAGTYRSTERNIGVAPHQINVQLRQLFDNVAAWDELDTYPVDERAMRLHHELTRIHPFPNGNGRVSRFIADYFLEQHGAARFTWGTNLQISEAERRARYLEAIRLADGRNYLPLLEFVRS